MINTITKVKRFLERNEQDISMILGALVVLVIGFVIVRFVQAGGGLW